MGGAGASLSNQVIAETSGLTVGTVSRNNRFFLSIGILSKAGSNILLTEKGSQLALAIDYNDVEDASRIWKSIVAETEFFKKILGALDIKREMTEEEFSQYISKTAGFPNIPDYIKGGKTVIDILKESGLIEVSENGKLIVTPEYRSLGTLPSTTGPKELSPQKEARIDDALKMEEEIQVIKSRQSASIAQVPIVLNINVAIGPDTTQDSIESIAARIKALREKIQ